MCDSCLAQLYDEFAAELNEQQWWDLDPDDSLEGQGTPPGAHNSDDDQEEFPIDPDDEGLH